MNGPALRWLGTTLLVACTSSLPACGKDGIGDSAMDRSFQAGKAYPVHPPRGERKKVRRSGAVSMQSDPLECNGPGEQVHANVELRVSAPTAVIVRGGCRLRLVNVDLVANDGVQVQDGTLVMVGGSIDARGVAIRAESTASVQLQGVTVHGATGLQASGQARVTTEDVRIEGSGAALALRDQVSVVLQHTELVGPVARDETAALTMIEGDASGSAGASGGEGEGEEATER